jgi:hypothetical protein
MSKKLFKKRKIQLLKTFLAPFPIYKKVARKALVVEKRHDLV